MEGVDREERSMAGNNETAGQALAGVELFLLDMDGTFYLGGRLLPGASAFMAALAETGRDFLFLTNNSSRDAGSYAIKLSDLGFPVGPGKILTSGEATIRYLRAAHAGARVYLLGTPALEEEFGRAGIELTESEPDLVVLGFDLTLTYHKLERACTFIRRGAAFIATHPDLNCPTEDGFIPDAGAMIAFITAATGRKPMVIGKPEPGIVEAAEAKTGVSRKAMAMVGDRLYTDIALGRRAGIRAVLALTGETTRADLEGSECRPDLVVEDLGELAAILRTEKALTAKHTDRTKKRSNTGMDA